MDVAKNIGEKKIWGKKVGNYFKVYTNYWTTAGVIGIIGRRKEQLQHECAIMEIVPLNCSAKKAVTVTLTVLVFSL